MFIFEVQKNGGDWAEYSRGSLIDCEDEQATIFIATVRNGGRMTSAHSVHTPNGDRYTARVREYSPPTAASRVEELLENPEGVMGVCIECGGDAFDYVEPDAEEYECQYCGAHAVAGLETYLLHYGRII